MAQTSELGVVSRGLSGSYRASVSTGSEALFHGRGEEKKKKKTNGRVSTAPVEHWRVMVSGVVVVACGQHLKFQRDGDPVVVDVAARRSPGSMD